MKANGTKTINMDKELKHGLMDQSLLELIKQDEEMDQVNSIGVMVLYIQDNSKMVKFKVMVNANGLMEKVIKGNGQII